jgi:SAM-dependent methyltransferase
MSSVVTPSLLDELIAERMPIVDRRSQQWLSRLALSELGQRVIEAGCGLGAWTKLLVNNREQVVALDPRPTCVAGVLARFPGQRNLDAMTMDLATSRFRDLARFQPDSVLCVDALAREHDDQRALFNFTTVLPRGGRVVLLVPAGPSLFGSLDMALGHRRRYSMESLRQLAQSVGLRACQMRYVNMAGFLGWWFDNCVLETVELAPAGSLRERLVPYLEQVERLIAPPFGQSLFAVLELPA